MKKISAWYVVFDAVFAIMSLSVAIISLPEIVGILQKPKRTPWDSLNMVWFCAEIILALGFMVRSAVISAYKVIYSAQDEKEELK